MLYCINANTYWTLKISIKNIEQNEEQEQWRSFLTLWPMWPGSPRRPKAPGYPCEKIISLDTHRLWYLCIQTFTVSDESVISSWKKINKSMKLHHGNEKWTKFITIIKNVTNKDSNNNACQHLVSSWTGNTYIHAYRPLRSIWTRLPRKTL